MSRAERLQTLELRYCQQIPLYYSYDDTELITLQHLLCHLMWWVPILKQTS